jgi:SAP domain
MAAPRSSSFKALRNLQKASSSAPARRNLHITGSNSSPQVRSPPPKHTYAPLTLSDLRDECRRRSILYTGTKHELVDRLAIHDSMQSRAFSIAMRKLDSEQPRKGLGARSPAERPPNRHFNTSRELKALNDSSTIDFAYLPKLFDGSLDPPPRGIRVPILPHMDSTEAQGILARNPELDAAAGGFQEPGGNTKPNSVMRAQIVTAQETMADGGAYVDLDLGSHASPMSEVVDNHDVELGIDRLTELTETVGKSARKMVDRVEGSALRPIWKGLMDDIFGEKKSDGTRSA